MRRHDERLCDVISLRVSPQQRAFLEKIAEARGIGICEASRVIIDEVMNNSMT